MTQIIFYSKNGHAYNSVINNKTTDVNECLIADEFKCKWTQLRLETKEIITQRGIKKYNKIWSPDMQQYAVIDPKE